MLKHFKVLTFRIMLVSCLIPDACCCIKIFPSGAEQAFKHAAFKKAWFYLIQLFSPKTHFAGLQTMAAV